jgi:hypothetical protein
MSCAQLLHAARQSCKLDDEECLRRHGVYSSTPPCAQATRCEVSGMSRAFSACLPAAHPQTVHGMPIFGGPSRVVASDPKRRE